MIEIAEASVYAKQMAKVLKSKTIVDVKVLSTPHTFCWMSSTPDIYESILLGNVIHDVKSKSHYIKFVLNDDLELAVGEDVTYEYKKEDQKSDKHQLQLTLNDGYVLELKIKIYGFILLGKEEVLKSSYLYYKLAMDAIHPLDPAFTYDHFIHVTELNVDKGSVKQALATNQHIPGIGNGTLQDILFEATISPKRKIKTLTEEDKVSLYKALQHKVDEIITFGGRNTTSNMFGEKGSYDVIMSNDKHECPKCHEALVKEAYLGGKVIYCPHCQK